MKAELKAAWITALTDGSHEQGTGTLRTPDNKFCCFGVLAHITGRGEIFDDTLHGMRIPGDSNDYNFNTFPNSLLLELGIPTQLERKLILMNDRGMLFERLAAFIEEHIPVDEDTPKPVSA